MQIRDLYVFAGMLACVLALAVPALAQSPDPSPPADQLARFLEITRATLKHPARSTPVQRQEIEVGKRADGLPLLVDLTLPKNLKAGQKLPVAILIHGGLPDAVPVRPRQWQVYRDWGAAIASGNAATIMFDHTLGRPKARLDQAMVEIDAVLRWIAEQGMARGLDAKRITAVTFSAGALLVPALSNEPRVAQLRSVVMFYPLAGVDPSSPAAAAMDKPLIDRLSLRSAAADIAARGIPLLILRAGKDEIPSLLAVLDDAVAALLAADAAVEIVNLPRMPHSFDMIVDDPQVRDSIERVVRHIGEVR